MIDLTSISLIGPKGERFGCDGGCDVDIDLCAKLAERNNVVLVFSDCYFVANLPSLLCGDVADVVD